MAISPQYVGRAPRVVALAGSEKLAYLKKVYALFTTSILAAAGGAMFALYAGAGASNASIQLRDGSVATIPPLVALFSRGWLGLLLGFGLMFGGFMLASAVRFKPGLNLVALHGAAAMSGIYIAPMLFFVQITASQSQTLSSSPIRDAFLLASVGFAGLTGYTMVSKRDFSFLSGFVSIGIFVLIGAGLLNLFFQSSVFGLAVASAGVVLFGGYVLYDTSKIVREGNEDPIGAAIRIYLDFFNLFIYLLSILSSSRSRD